MITPNMQQEQRLRVLGDRLMDPLSRAWDVTSSADPRETIALRDATRAGILHDHFVNELGPTFEGDSEWELVESEQLWVLRSSFAAVRFNKVDHARHASQNRTGQSQQWNYGKVDLFGDAPLLALRFGYVIDPTWSSITEAVITQQVGRSIRWSLPFSLITEQEHGAMPESLRRRSVRLVGDKLARQMEIQEENERKFQRNDE